MRNPSAFDLADLRLLAAIATTGSLSKAAAGVPVAVSAASTRLRQFEARCGIAVFVRTAEGMTPTPAGRLLLEQARDVLASAEALRETLAGLAGQRRSVLRLAATTVATSSFLPAALGPFLADYPEVDLKLVEQRSDEILLAVENGQAEIGVYDGNLPTGGLVSLPFRDDRLVLLVAARHALAARAEVSLRDALGFPFIGLQAERSMQRFIEDMATRNAMPLRIRVRAPGFDAIAQFVAQNAGIAMLPEAAAARHAAELPVRIVRLTDAWATRELRLCLRALEALPTHARALVRYLTPARPAG
ncbi:MAG: LysR family transcriptional regulator [Candidatus Dactylopiibacterium sp.]|nr:LysR family transcriptional regulator [Candidatus Dactylopiibacterium sp.]